MPWCVADPFFPGFEIQLLLRRAVVPLNELQGAAMSSAPLPVHQAGIGAAAQSAECFC